MVVGPAPVRAQVCGDADGDDVITVTDGVNVLRAAANLSNACTLARCDIDVSGGITVTDGVNVLRAAADLPNACGNRLGFCGGIAGIPCPSGEECVDVPNDGCDPARGGADCSGQCEPTTPAGCSVASDCPRPGAPCVLCADGSTACPITFCDRVHSECGVVFQTCPAATCGGIAALACPEGQKCLDDPRDDCDPNANGADCSGVCVL